MINPLTLMYPDSIHGPGGFYKTRMRPHLAMRRDLERLHKGV